MVSFARINRQQRCVFKQQSNWRCKTEPMHNLLLVYQPFMTRLWDVHLAVMWCPVTCLCRTVGPLTPIISFLLVALRLFKHIWTRKYNHIWTRKYKHISTRKYKHTSTRKYKHISTRKYKHISIRKYKHISTRKYKHISTRKYNTSQLVSTTHLNS